MSKITVTGQLTLTGGQLTAKATAAAPTGDNLWTWGRNQHGQLGLGDTDINRSSPVQVGNLTDWASINNNVSQSFAIKTNGTLWAWGLNFTGELGLGDTVNRSSPVQVGALTDWSSIELGGVNAFAIKTNGSLWAIGGLNSRGQFGLGDTVNRSSPVQIGALTDWVSVGPQGSTTHAIKTNGSLWGWGDARAGRLGNGTIIDRSSPVQVGSDTDWASIVGGRAFSLAVKTNSSLWSWGRNNKGQLGHGDIINRSSPVQVGSLTDWVSINSGYTHSLAIKTNGSLWSWGDNSPDGRLGDGTIVDRSSPIQIGALTTWANASAGQLHSHAIKTNGKLWAWGQNEGAPAPPPPRGQLGDGTIVDKSSPVQIGSDTNWIDISNMNYHSIALKSGT